MRHLLLLLTLTVYVSLAAQGANEITPQQPEPEQIVARVGDYAITLSELEEQMDILYDNSEEPWTYEQLRETALQKLIDEQLMLQYARESELVVSSREVDNYFISLYGQHSKFQTNGHFDRYKYNSLKNTPNIQAILGDLHRELLVGKARSILESQFNIDDEELLDRYIYDRFRFDLGYIIVKEDLVDVDPDLSPEDAYHWWQQRRSHYQTPRQLRLKLLVVPDDDFADQAVIDETELLNAYAARGLTAPFEEVRDSLLAAMQVAEMREMSRSEADRLRNLLSRGDAIERETVITRWLHEGETLGQLMKADVILADAFRQHGNAWSKLYDAGWGWVAFRVVDDQPAGPAPLNKVGRKVWRDYVEYRYTNTEDDRYREWFYANIDSFIVSAAKLTRVIIDPDSLVVDTDFGDGEMRQYYNLNQPRFERHGRLIPYDKAIPEIRDALRRIEQHRLALDLRQQVRENIHNTRELSRIASRYGLPMERRLVLLDRFRNEDRIDDEIALKLSEDKDTGAGELMNGNAFVLWRVHTMFIDYIPQYDLVRDQVLHMARKDFDNGPDIDYNAWFQRNISSYQSHDSLALAGVIVPVRPDTIVVNNWSINNYYSEHPTDFYTPPRVLLDFVFIEDSSGDNGAYAKQLMEQVDGGMSLALLQRTIGKPCVITPGEPIALADLPLPVKNAVETMKSGDLSQPIYYGDGWYIVRKLADYPPHLQQLDEVREEIRRKLADYAALMGANRYARGVFEQAETFEECAAYADSSLLFETELTEVSEHYPVLGNILPYESKWMQLWTGEKYSSIVNADSAVAVVFLKQKSQSQTITFEEALPRIKREVTEEYRQQAVRKYIRNIIASLEQGGDPARILPFFGVWREMEGLRLDSDLPGVEYSSLVLAGVPDSELWKYSQPLRISDDEYLFYRVSRMQKVRMEEFDREKKAYRHKLQRDAFNRWLQDYRTQVGVEVFE